MGSKVFIQRHRLLGLTKYQQKVQNSSRGYQLGTGLQILLGHREFRVETGFAIRNLQWVFKQ